MLRLAMEILLHLGFTMYRVIQNQNHHFLSLTLICDEPALTLWQSSVICYGPYFELKCCE